MINLTLNKEVTPAMLLKFQSYDTELKSKIKNKTATVGIIGLGYVGLPTACYYAAKGFRVTGFDVSTEKVNSLNSGISYINDISNEQLHEIVSTNFFEATTDMKMLGMMDIILICVPTPINDVKEPNLTYVNAAGNTIAQHVTKGSLVILESTTYPGTTERFIVAPLVKRGFKVGETVFVAYSPERIDPGNKEYDLTNTPKVIGGMTKKCSEIGSEFIGDNAHLVNGVRVAELSKIFENTFRWINTALVNELAVLCKEMDIDIWETIDAASSKPYGFMKFTPGIGVGGHCIPVDPYYLTFKAKKQGQRTKMIELAGEINDGMVHYSYVRILELLAENGKLMKNASIVVLGAAYKKDIGDLRESPIVRLIEKLQDKVKNLNIIEPHSQSKEILINGKKLPNSKYNVDIVKNADLVVIGTPHSCFDWEQVFQVSNLIFDSKNIMEEQGYVSDKITKL
ncbi:nucleotide sugar dehydrogenase [Gottfriedia sp. NPDC057991]|uniref:nucleotide sugar dehydrogenase n=1 Tax=Gottfriedia sp. NPDC057991 TaxID=3346298 RepID=UPI0036DE6385